jgi:hypothetical protein
MVVVPLRLQRGVVVARSSVEESPGSSEAFDGTLAQSDGLRGLEPADVISTMFIAARGRKVSGPTMFAETKENSAGISVAYRK